MVLVVYSLVDFRNSKQIVVVWKQSDNLVESLKYDEMCLVTKPDCVLSLNVHVYQGGQGSRKVGNK